MKLPIEETEQAFANGYSAGYEAGRRSAGVQKHGRWEQVGDAYVCGEYCYRCTNCLSDEWMTFGHMKRFAFCPFCGAKMDGGADNA